MRHKLKELTVELKPSPMLPGEIGLFAARSIRRGENVCPGETVEDDFITKEEFTALSPALQNKVRSFTSGRAGGFLIEAGLDFNELPTSFFANHSCAGNLGFDAEGDFIALRDISAGEELVYDYGLVEAGADFQLACRCGAATCRKIITGHDWQNEEFRKQHKDYMYPDLKAGIAST